ncbi:MAG: hypothetical protein JXA49_08815 [Actinobacteria bacterium]|nr:hypothetical protein [Actinomycetota bacterium]
MNGMEREMAAAIPAADKKQVSARTILIPDIPLNGRDIAFVDKELISSLASDYCRREGDRASDAEFFLGYLPLRSTDGLCVDSADFKQIGSLLGNFIVSGFFGGIWLRDSLGLSSFSKSPARQVTKAIGGPLFSLFTAFARKGIKISMEGSKSTVFISNLLFIFPFMILYGYNWGYFNYILDNPPGGTTFHEEYKSACHRLLDVRMPYDSPETLELYKPVLDKLYASDLSSRPNKRWKQIGFIMKFLSKLSASTGNFVWHIMMNDSMSGSLYELLLELSGRYMLVAELCLLPAMKCFAESDNEAGRCAILQQVAMMLWTGSYLLGLISDKPFGTFPSAGFST